MKNIVCLVAIATGTGIVTPTLAHPFAVGSLALSSIDGVALKIVSPTEVTDADSFDLDVKFNGGNLSRIELFLDGSLIKGQDVVTHEGNGTISFSIEAGTIASGKHVIKIKAFDVNGNAKVTSTTVDVAGTMDSILSLVTPRRNSVVQGTVPFEVAIDSSLKSPYVMFFMDDEFLALMNYAPFSYNWDSSKASNGKHKLTAKVYDGASANEVRSMTFPVNVDNVGGETHLSKDIVDLRTKPNAKKLVAGEFGSAPFSMDILFGENSLFSSDQLSPALHAMRMQTPTANLTAKHAIAAKKSGMSSHFVPTPKTRAFTSEMVSILPVETSYVNDVMRSPIKIAHPGGFATVPSSRLAAPKSTRTRTATSLPTFKSKSFEVVFDNTQIAFDVPPRVVNGLPFAPFRAIFEHSGGTITWFGKSKTVRAISENREIEFRIGSDEAKVNNQSVHLEKKAFIDHGRSIVPLSFFKDSMDVDVKFDAATGRIRIETKK